jgi:hypothetical protein
MRRIWLLLSFTSALFPQSRENDSLIVPGVRVGPVTRSSTEQSVRKAFGRLAVKANIEVGEGEEEPGLVLYPADPGRRLEITWNNDQPPHPAMIFICRSEDNRACQWHTAHGIGIGTTLRELEKANGRPFEMVGWGTDVGGNLTSFQGGQLEKELRGHQGALALSLVPRIDQDGTYLPRLTNREFSDVEGEKFLLSNHPVLQKLNPYVGALSIVFPSAERRR